MNVKKRKKYRKNKKSVDFIFLICYITNALKKEAN